MSLSVEMKVNGKTIGSAYIVNRLFLEDDLEGLVRYEYKLVHNGKTKGGHVIHERRQGAWELVARVIEDVRKKI